MRFYPLEKIVLEIDGQAEKFLNGVTSNSLDRPQNAFLDIHGRIVASFEQIKIKSEKYLIAIEKKFYDTLMQHLDKFIKLGGVRFLKTDYRVFFNLAGGYQNSADEYVIPQRKGELIFTGKNLTADVSPAEFTLFRLKNHIPLQGVDYAHEMILNVDENEMVSYTKGCFLGQEFVSKVYSRSKPSWKLLVRREDECTPEEKQKMTSGTFDPDTGQVLGFVFVANH